MQNSDDIWRRVDAKQDAYIALSDRIWGMPELNYQEHRSAAEHVAACRPRASASRPGWPASRPRSWARPARAAR